MPNKVHEYYVGDAVTFRGTFKIDGVAQIPDADSAKVSIYKVGTATAALAETAATIADAQLRYQYTPLVVGTFALFFTTTFSSGSDKRTGVIEFVVRNKGAN